MRAADVWHQHRKDTLSLPDGCVIFNEPFASGFHGLFKGSEFECLQIAAQLCITGSLLELPVRL